ncbi:uroporphyrinogen decarboxylase [Sistotremastrum suecicum HHB10207 ss-3]|uniref:Uroporphyrinogen decarboxylase n=1 Tax=Sistotremastrum suecicum HHB10207 ss-3 TaxID=1314776 RepID=A0A166DV36_9AGAM|nr:uroporphyrinogen decarboxylase [Sistotremastrum suecicum HHB10207 ss-3]
MVPQHDFPPLTNDLILRAARGEQTERAPVWVMRQAGRYLPEYRELRKNHEFFEICQTPALAAEFTLQPIRRYSGLLDAAIIFCDIMVVPQAMGLEVIMNPGPSLPNPIRELEDLKRLREEVDVDKELGYVYDAITLTRKELKGQVPLIGFCGAPWTLMAYMIEGGGSKSFQLAKSWLFKYPEESKALLLKIGDVCADYLVGQIRAGAQMAQVFDSWASELSTYDFITFSLPSLKHIASKVRSRLDAEGIPQVPLTLFAKGANSTLDIQAKEAGYDTIGLDWIYDLATARSIVGDGVALQGNFDPNVLYGGREAIDREVKRVCQSFLGGKAPKAWIANLGHGITPGVDPDDLKFFLECVHKYSAAS